ncbi:hypothetical protein BLOT_008300 [Blomia tropicalis]|nr:hypothetical protein BLOT_008300 [Blomia tropicalis]
MVRLKIASCHVDLHICLGPVNPCPPPPKRPVVPIVALYFTKCKGSKWNKPNMQPYKYLS